MIEITQPMMGKRVVAIGVWRQLRSGHCVPRGERGWHTVNGVFLQVGRWGWSSKSNSLEKWGRCLWIGLNWKKRLDARTSDL